MEKIILKYLTGSINDKELSELEEYLKNPENEKIFRDFITDDFNLNKIYNKVDVHSAFDNVERGITSEPKVIPLYKRRRFIYAAACLLVGFLSIPFFLYQKKTVKNDVPVIVNNNIKAGTNKAILTLGDGSKVVLDQGKPYATKKMHSNGEELIYQPNRTPEPRLSYHYLTIPNGGQYQITLEDGTQVWLNSESKLKYPETFIPGEDREVELVYGEAYFDVSPSSDHNGAKFRVKTREQEIEVLGTEFNVKAYLDEESIYSTLVEGNILITSDFYKNSISPHQQTIFNTKNNTVDLITVKDLYTVNSWREGVFSFKDMPFVEIMKVLSRWYDAEIIFTNKQTEEMLFTGVLDKSQPIEEILFTIYVTNNINYEINNKTIIFK